MKLIANILENIPDLVLGQAPFDISALKTEYEKLEHQVLFNESYRLWDLAELKYQYGLTCYRLGRALVDKAFLKKARDAFVFVKGTVAYRHPTCTTEMLDTLIRACE